MTDEIVTDLDLLRAARTRLRRNLIHHYTTQIATGTPRNSTLWDLNELTTWIEVCREIRTIESDDRYVGDEPTGWQKDPPQRKGSWRLRREGDGLDWSAFDRSAATAQPPLVPDVHERIEASVTWLCDRLSLLLERQGADSRRLDAIQERDEHLNNLCESISAVVSDISMKMTQHNWSHSVSHAHLPEDKQNMVDTYVHHLIDKSNRQGERIEALGNVLGDAVRKINEMTKPFINVEPMRVAEDDNDDDAS